jgi:hypothetical protein
MVSESEWREKESRKKLKWSVTASDKAKVEGA